ncbi:aminotransferase class I/II-fold pyridoxal phosphate-dependent enzyme [Rhodococcus erythropolis]|nr:aminotransferase class I/II-fold pyridoxal phosphate-dependent enzyme [Rhodococcus erythropolis]
MTTARFDSIAPTTYSTSVVSDVPAYEDITVEDLRAAGSMKWTKYPDTLAAFVAEMDFGVATPVAEAVTELVTKGLLGYLPNWMESDLQSATADWCQRRFDWEFDPGSVFAVADVIRAYEFAIKHFSNPESKIVLMTPAYGPFFHIAQHHGREVVEVPMLREDNRWVIDYEGIDAAFENGGGLLVLCNPHNPVGKVYTETELSAVAEIIDRRGGTVFSDEIHAPIVYSGQRHIPYASVSDLAANHCLTATSASKAFNVPGLKCAQLIATGEHFRTRLEKLGMVLTHGASNAGVVANTAAYTQGDPWLDSVRTYLEGNRNLLIEALAEHLPNAHIIRPDATYFGWINLQESAPTEGAQHFFLEHARVAISDGPSFGLVGREHIRFNFALPRKVIPVAVEALGTAMRSGAIPR